MIGMIITPTPMPAAALTAAVPQTPIAVASAVGGVGATPPPETSRRPWTVTLIAGLTALAGLLQDALALPLFDGGNMGVRRRQLHELLRAGSAT